MFDSSADQRHIDTPIFMLLVNDEQCCLGTVGVWLKCRPAPHRHSDLHGAVDSVDGSCEVAASVDLSLVQLCPAAWLQPQRLGHSPAVHSRRRLQPSQGRRNRSDLQICLLRIFFFCDLWIEEICPLDSCSSITAIMESAPALWPYFNLSANCHLTPLTLTLKSKSLLLV